MMWLLSVQALQDWNAPVFCEIRVSLFWFWKQNEQFGPKTCAGDSGSRFLMGVDGSTSLVRRYLKIDSQLMEGIYHDIDKSKDRMINWPGYIWIFYIAHRHGDYWSFILLKGREILILQYHQSLHYAWFTDKRSTSSKNNSTGLSSEESYRVMTVSAILLT